MPRPGFYNDNEYRAYPFVFATAADPFPKNLIVDAGIIMRLDSGFDETTHTVWLAKITRIGSNFYFEFKTDSTAVPLVFVRDIGATAAEDWQTEYAESASQVPCAEFDDPVWEGFLVTGLVKELVAFLPADGAVGFTKDTNQLEPARIQNLNKSYLRTVNVGNYERVQYPTDQLSVTNYCNNDPSAPRDIILNRECLGGDIRFKEGYNCVIRQIDRANELTITAIRGAGDGSTSRELCDNSGELPLFPGEKPPTGEVVATTFIAELDIHGIFPPTSEQLDEVLPSKCAPTLKIGDTYGWRSNLKLSRYYDIYYYTWNHHEWARSNLVRFYIDGPTTYDFPYAMPQEVTSMWAFYSGGPRCCDLISTINGIGGPVVTLAGGTGINITTQTDPPRIVISKNVINVTGCAAE